VKSSDLLHLVAVLIFTLLWRALGLAGVPGVAHDVAITRIFAVSEGAQDCTIPVVVVLENQSKDDELLEVRLTDVTSGKEIGGKSARLPPPRKWGIDGICDLTLTGEAGGRQNFGDWLAVGSVNGDDCDDLLVSAALHNNEQGRVYLYYGGANMDDRPDMIFTGENTGDRFGAGGGYLADMNNDGFDDVIIGARFFDNGRGRIYVYWGGPDMDEKADITIEAEPGVTNCNFGRGITVGDVNGDGHLDLIVSAIRYRDYTGRTYLFYGPIAADTTADKVFTGENTNDTFGAVLCAREDVDGDGCDDLLVGTLYYPHNTRSGRAYLYYGDPGTSMDETCDLTFDAENVGDQFACSIDLFDVDNDGHADVIIGASRWPARTFQGRVYLYWGSSRTTMDNIADLHFDGEVGAKSKFGGNSVMGGYVNNDDFGDIIVSAYDYYRFSQQGRAYLYYGNTKASMDTTCDRTITPEGAQNQPQRTRIGDFNGDNSSDIVMGGYEYNDYQGRCLLWHSGHGSSTEVTFYWDTTTATPGKHTLRATIAPVAGEEDTADNSMTVVVEVKPSEDR
jgi:hypothetical protein